MRKKLLFKLHDHRLPQVHQSVHYLEDVVLGLYLSALPCFILKGFEHTPTALAFDSSMLCVLSFENKRFFPFSDSPESLISYLQASALFYRRMVEMKDSKAAYTRTLKIFDKERILHSQLSRRSICTFVKNEIQNLGAGCKMQIQTLN